MRSVEPSASPPIGLVQPERHVHRTEEVTCRRDRGRSRLGVAPSLVQLTEAVLTVPLQRPHPELLGEGERLAVSLLGSLEGAKKRLLAESRRGTEQLEFGLRETIYADALRRIRDRLQTLRARLAP